MERRERERERENEWRAKERKVRFHAACFETETLNKKT